MTSTHDAPALPPSRVREVVAFLVFSLVSSLVLLAVLEGAARLLLPHVKRPGTDASLLRPNALGDAVGWVPGARGEAFDEEIEIDERGFRRIPGPASYDAAWALLGDSVTAGVGVPVEETYAARLQRAHAEVRVLNTAVIGYAVDDYVAVLEALLTAGEPIRRAIVFLCLNDVADRMNLAATGSPLARARSWLADGSVLFQWVRGTFLEPSRDYYEAVAPVYSPDSKEWKRLSDGLDRLAAIARAHDVDLRVVVLPFEYQLREDDPARLAPQRALDALLTEKGIPHVDLAPVLAQAGVPATELYLFGDAVHFTAAGHARVAEAVERWLRDQSR